MNKGGTFVLVIAFISIFGLFCSSCQEKSTEKISEEMLQTTEIEVDTKRIEKIVGIQFDVLENKTIGYSPTHKFLWICVYKDLQEEKLSELAKKIIEAMTTREPNTYHSFTIHFFKKEDILNTVEGSKSFARVEFLPFGDWLQLGRNPINGYKNYELICDFY